MKGTVKWYNARKGYGFITPDDNSDDVFVHATSLKECGLKKLYTGSEVTYETDEDKKGKRAKLIKVTKELKPKDEKKDTKKKDTKKKDTKKKEEKTKKKVEKTKKKTTNKKKEKPKKKTETKKTKESKKNKKNISIFYYSFHCCIKTYKDGRKKYSVYL